ncbi:NUDIX hydrolase [Streptomyces spectabilis]|uniref:NUDIX hydrolase n=1 Tax=Streptomyces spectabilis TaxID=68270 RepID=UPI0033EED185
MHKDIDQADPPALRRGCVVLIRSGRGAVLLVKPRYKPGWQLPGGHAHEGEPSASAAARELREETGLARQLSDVLLVDDVPASEDGKSAAGINLVFDGGTLVGEPAVERPESARDELSGIKWVAVHEIEDHTAPYQSRRIRAALSCADQGMRVPILRLGIPAPAA